MVRTTPTSRPATPARDMESVESKMSMVPVILQQVASSLADFARSNRTRVIHKTSSGDSKDSVIPKLYDNATGLDKVSGALNSSNIAEALLRFTDKLNEYTSAEKREVRQLQKDLASFIKAVKNCEKILSDAYKQAKLFCKLNRYKPEDTTNILAPISTIQENLKTIRKEMGLKVAEVTYPDKQKGLFSLLGFGKSTSVRTNELEINQQSTSATTNADREKRRSEWRGQDAQTSPGIFAKSLRSLGAYFSSAQRGFFNLASPLIKLFSRGTSVEESANSSTNESVTRQPRRDSWRLPVEQRGKYADWGILAKSVEFLHANSGKVWNGASQIFSKIGRAFKRVETSNQTQEISAENIQLQDRVLVENTSVATASDVSLKQEEAGLALELKTAISEVVKNWQQMYEENQQLLTKLQDMDNAYSLAKSFGFDRPSDVADLVTINNGAIKEKINKLEGLNFDGFLEGVDHSQKLFERMHEFIKIGDSYQIEVTINSSEVRNTGNEAIKSLLHGSSRIISGFKKFNKNSEVPANLEISHLALQSLITETIEGVRDFAKSIEDRAGINSEFEIVENPANGDGVTEELGKVFDEGSNVAVGDSEQGVPVGVTTSEAGVVFITEDSSANIDIGVRKDAGDSEIHFVGKRNSSISEGDIERNSIITIGEESAGIPTLEDNKDANTTEVAVLTQLEVPAKSIDDQSLLGTVVVAQNPAETKVIQQLPVATAEQVIQSQEDQGSTEPVADSKAEQNPEAESVEQPSLDKPTPTNVVEKVAIVPQENLLADASSESNDRTLPIPEPAVANVTSNEIQSEIPTEFGHVEPHASFELPVTAPSTTRTSSNALVREQQQKLKLHLESSTTPAPRKPLSEMSLTEITERHQAAQSRYTKLIENISKLRNKLNSLDMIVNTSEINQVEEIQRSERLMNTLNELIHKRNEVANKVRALLKGREFEVPDGTDKAEREKVFKANSMILDASLPESVRKDFENKKIVSLATLTNDILHRRMKALREQADGEFNKLTQRIVTTFNDQVVFSEREDGNLIIQNNKGEKIRFVEVGEGQLRLYRMNERGKWEIEKRGIILTSNAEIMINRFLEKGLDSIKLKASTAKYDTQYFVPPPNYIAKNEQANSAKTRTSATA